MRNEAMSMLRTDYARAFLQSNRNGRTLMEHASLPWHETYPDITKKLLNPSTIYAPLIAAAQGGVDGDVQVPLVACAHISGGGVPLKAGRMLSAKGLGMHLDTVFPDPEGIPELVELARCHPHADGSVLVDERTACEQWNRGVGFLCVLENESDSDVLLDLAQKLGYEAALAGITTENPQISWRGHVW
jgi:phosphoribosylaminoimidazole (AIR) synthetase